MKRFSENLANALLIIVALSAGAVAFKIWFQPPTVEHVIEYRRGH